MAGKTTESWHFSHATALVMRIFDLFFFEIPTVFSSSSLLSFFLRDFNELKLPQAIRIVGNFESAITDNEHENAQLEVKELAFLDPPNQSPKHRPLLENVIKDKTVHYGNEAGVTALVLLYLEAVIKAGGLGKKIETFVDLYVAKYRPDVVVIYNERRIPCGVVEVKLRDSPIDRFFCC